MGFQEGDWVEVLDESIRGKVLKIEGPVVTISMEDGFSLQYAVSELIPAQGEIRVTNYEAAQIKSQKDAPAKKPKKTPKPKERNIPKMEVDLHVHQLVKSTKGMSNFDILNVQLETAKRRLDFAIAKRIQKVVFIHGVGEGVLKEELRYLFKKYDNLKYYDAEYQKYGMGATEVYIYQNN
ncbi:Smr/MutS family protein [Flagellimonas allohymeniacidonis]|uniref:DNA mismatch repair protein MutS n=1 Tax=Flagellimonas allohymeniacidonis TaxID=2517819 RepID=A0A4Q8QHS4_9FLAO|nr:Smr/MutS family protein [Allomuricauda hymeniacidonis]TAI49347.1 DNA mismatch repair protein MutS [Allomuricauda hymeniacidonis]